MMALCTAGLWAKVDIQSDSLRILQRGEVNQFTGNVVIVSDNIRVNAKKAVSRKNESIVEATGDVFVTYSSGTWKVESWCSSLKIMLDEEKFEMTGDVRSDYREAGSTVSTLMNADKATFYYGGEQKAFFEGSVKAVREGITVNSGRAFYSQYIDMIEFTQDPVARSATETLTSVYSGDIINLYTEVKRIKITGNANTKVFFKNEPGM